MNPDILTAAAAHLAELRTVGANLTSQLQVVAERTAARDAAAAALREADDLQARALDDDDYKRAEAKVKAASKALADADASLVAAQRIAESRRRLLADLEQRVRPLHDELQVAARQHAHSLFVQIDEELDTALDPVREILAKATTLASLVGSGHALRAMSEIVVPSLAGAHRHLDGMRRFVSDKPVDEALLAEAREPVRLLRDLASYVPHAQRTRAAAPYAIKGRTLSTPAGAELIR